MCIFINFIQLLIMKSEIEFYLFSLFISQAPLIGFLSFLMELYNLLYTYLFLFISIIIKLNKAHCLIMYNLVSVCRMCVRIGMRAGPTGNQFY